LWKNIPTEGSAFIKEERSMAHKTISDDEMMTRALDLFRTYGFDGVSLKQLADSMGMEKASLYYRFPGGKDEIALAVATSVDSVMRQHVLIPLSATGISPRRRVQLACDELREFYGGGKKSCTLDVMSIPGASEDVKKVLRGTLQSWLDAFTTVSREAGLTAARARKRAEEAIMRIEGSLVMSRVLGESGSFERTLKQLPGLLTEDSPKQIR
jgi:TetR/AcrR family transcriptional regulator, lmrAB and yxaGH operons repressor